MKRLIGLLIIMVLLVGVVIAQEGDPADCDYTAMGERLVEAGESLAESDDPAAVVAALQSELATFRAGCDGLSFTSEEYGLSKVTDPIEFPDGLYRAIAESAETFSAEFTEIDGDCGMGFYAVIGDEGRTEEVAELEGCIALVTFDGRADWTLTLEKIR